MTDIETALALALDDLAEQAPAYRPRADRYAGRPASRRWAVPLAVAAVVALVVSAPFVVAGLRDKGNDRAPAFTTATTTAGRMVGVGRLAIRVPQAWTTNDYRCGAAESDTVLLLNGDSDVFAACGHVGTQAYSDVQLVPAMSRSGQQWLHGLPRTGTLAQHPLYSASVTDSDGLLVTTFAIPDLDAVLRVDTPDGPDVAQGLVATAQAIPGGYVALPTLVNQSPEQAAEALRDAGLEVIVPVHPQGAIVRTLTPVPGTVVRTGTTVTVVTDP